MKKIQPLFLLLFYSITSFTQIDLEGTWSDVNENTLQGISSERWIIPQKYRTIQLLNIINFVDYLGASPAQNNAEGLSQIITIPMPDGTSQQFAITKSDLMHPDLAAKFPQILTFSGIGIDDSQAKVYLDFTPAGFHAMVLSPKGSVFIDPYFNGPSPYYMSYYKKNYTSEAAKNWSCSFENEKPLVQDKTEFKDKTIEVGKARNALATINMRTYRIAIAANGEYTAFHGGTVALGLAAINTALNRVRGVYEDELAVSFQLVANNNLIVFTDAGTDPYSNNSNAINENEGVIDGQIGDANYDVGHVFTTGSGGVAGLGVICNNNRKADGTTGLGSPTGDPFHIDYVAHELGHQFGGNHTFNGDSGSCAGGNRNGSTAYEPGSGSTIQAYAGICGDDNIQNNSDPYFHLVSLNEMRTHVTSGSGGNCGTLSTSNTTPVVNANFESIDGKTIPESTPFELTGAATDADNLTYSWEEWDLGPQSDLNSPGTNAPLFRSFEATSSPTRIFPKLSAILNNTTSLGELLPTVGRTLRFQFIARDDNIAGGYGSGMITLNVADGTGPFKINSPNTSGTFSGNTAVTWDVAGTNVSPINCSQVDIYLSTDGGQTFSQLLVDNTTNDGSANVILPEINISTARLKLKCADNVFFDINDANFTVQPTGNNNCAITNITAGATSACDGNDNTYTQQITVTFNDAPASGNLVVNNQSFTLATSPQTVLLTGLNADGNSVNVTAAFSDNFTCSATVNNLFTAPNACVENICIDYNSEDTPISISASGTPTITSNISIVQAGTITDVNIKNLNGTHTWMEDLTFTITSPQGTTVTLFSNICGSQDDFSINFDDAGNANNSIPCPPTDGGTYQAESSLSVFNDQTATGTWVLTVADNFAADGGSLNGWTLEVCTFNEIIPEDDCNVAIDAIINDIPIAADTFQSAGTITSAGTVVAGTTVVFKAKNSITLTTGFHAIVTANHSFSAIIEDCSNNAFEAATLAAQQIPELSTAETELQAIKSMNATKLNIYPNPFSYQTTISYDMNKPSEVSIRLFDLNGQEIRQFSHNSFKEAGAYELQLDSANLPNGIYLLHFQTKETVRSKRLVIQH